ncbi:MAG: acetate--CoA ligase family protein, partial [Pseudomonadota bacterium]
FLVEEMVTGAVAELLVGVVADPAHGYVLTLAAGGTLTELLDDSTSLLIPAGREAVAEALDRLRIAPLLHGYRGRPAADIEAILDAVMAVQAYVTVARPQEIEINPLLCTPSGATAADALIRTGD